MPSVKGLDPLEASSAALYLPPEVVINQVVKTERVIKSSSWKYLTELSLDVIKYPEGGTQEIPTPQQVALWKSMRRRQEHRHTTASYPKNNPRLYPISVPGSSAPGFGE